jgi:hypothetical protein
MILVSQADGTQVELDGRRRGRSHRPTRKCSSPRHPTQAMHGTDVVDAGEPAARDLGRCRRRRQRSRGHHGRRMWRSARPTGADRSTRRRPGSNSRHARQRSPAATACRCSSADFAGNATTSRSPPTAVGNDHGARRHLGLIRPAAPAQARLHRPFIPQSLTLSGWYAMTRNLLIAARSPRSLSILLAALPALAQQLQHRHARHPDRQAGRTSAVRGSAAARCKHKVPGRRRHGRRSGHADHVGRLLAGRRRRHLRQGQRRHHAVVGQQRRHSVLFEHVGGLVVRPADRRMPSSSAAAPAWRRRCSARWVRPPRCCMAMRPAHRPSAPSSPAISTSPARPARTSSSARSLRQRPGPAPPTPLPALSTPTRARPRPSCTAMPLATRRGARWRSAATCRGSAPASRRARRQHRLGRRAGAVQRGRRHAVVAHPDQCTACRSPASPPRPARRWASAASSSACDRYDDRARLGRPDQRRGRQCPDDLLDRHAHQQVADLAGGDRHGRRAAGALALRRYLADADRRQHQRLCADGFSTATTLRLNTDASRNITGLAGGAGGRVIVIHNVGAFNIVLTNQDAASTAANRFLFGGDMTLAADTSVTIKYDDVTSSRWRAITSPGAGGGGTWWRMFRPIAARPRSSNALTVALDRSIVMSSGSTGGFASGVNRPPLGRRVQRRQHLPPRAGQRPLVAPRSWRYAQRHLFQHRRGRGGRGRQRPGDLHRHRRHIQGHGRHSRLSRGHRSNGRALGPRRRPS